MKTAERIHCGWKCFIEDNKTVIFKELPHDSTLNEKALNFDDMDDDIFLSIDGSDAAYKDVGNGVDGLLDEKSGMLARGIENSVFEDGFLDEKSGVLSGEKSGVLARGNSEVEDGFLDVFSVNLPKILKSQMFQTFDMSTLYLHCFDGIICILNPNIIS